MKVFTLRLLDATGSEDRSGITSFVTEDASGSFGIMSGHAPMVAVPVAGLSRFRRGAEAWEYLAASAAVMSFNDNVLTFACRRYFLGEEPEAISRTLERELQKEGELHLVTENLRQMEQEMLKRLWELYRGGGRVSGGVA